jgi:DNA-binding GntR family transcriptional regulator
VPAVLIGVRSDQMMDALVARAGKRVTLQDSVYNQLRSLLMRGRFDPGQSLVVQTLATTLQTSTMPVRGALLQLVSEGALEILPSGTTRVPGVSLEKLEDLCTARVAIEGLAAELACSRVSPSLIKQLRHLIVDHELSSEVDGVYPSLEKNQEFHFLIYRASGSTVLPQLIENLWLQYGPYLRLVCKNMQAPAMGPLRSHETDYHYEIVAALEKGDPVGTRAAIGRDINRTVGLLRELLVNI